MLGIDSEFLNEPVNVWKRTLRTLELTMLLNILKVVNDIAERGVKLASDFLTSAEIEKRYQNVLQVVENESFRVPNQRKLNKTSELWFLQY